MKYMPRDFFSALFEDDSDGVRHNIPNAKYKKWEINSLGFRGKEFNFEKKAGQVRIVCFGASETFGVFENNGKEMRAGDVNAEMGHLAAHRRIEQQCLHEFRRDVVGERSAGHPGGEIGGFAGADLRPGPGFRLFPARLGRHEAGLLLG